MTPQELKNSILQLAIQGRLVPQDPSEGSGEELFARIQAQKDRLIKEGKKKKKKTLPDITEDEIPLDIPKNWKWVRVANVWNVLNGDRGKNYPAKSTLTHKGIPFISALNLDGKTVINDENLLCMSELQFNKLGNGKLIKGDVVVCIRGSLGKHGRYPFEQGAIASSLVIMRSCLQKTVLDEYLMLYLDSPLFFSEIRKHDNGTAQPNLAANSLEQFLLPLPPLAEQQRIVAKTEELLPLIDQYEQAWSKLEEFNARFPMDMQKSILQMAIQGKLVPQDASEGTGEELYQKIQEEKAKLIKEGKIKKQKPLLEISEDEIPFDIPSNWKWCRLSSVGITQTGNTPSKAHPEYYGKKLPFIGPGDIQNGQINYSNQGLSSLGREQGRVTSSKSILQVCIGGSIGKCALSTCEVAFNQQINAILPILADEEYLLCVLKSEFFSGYMKEHSGGTATPIINRSLWDAIVIPLPPLAEQARIVSKIDQLLPLCERLSS